MFNVLLTKIKESFISVFPVAAIVFILNLTPLVTFSDTEFIVFLICTALLILGIGLFNLGADTAMTPIGEYVGTSVMRTKKLWIIIPVCFLVGVMITVSEPDLQVLATIE